MKTKLLQSQEQQNQKKKKIYEEALIINATPQTIENDLLNGLLDLKICSSYF